MADSANATSVNFVMKVSADEKRLGEMCAEMKETMQYMQARFEKKENYWTRKIEEMTTRETLMLARLDSMEAKFAEREAAEYDSIVKLIPESMSLNRERTLQEAETESMKMKIEISLKQIADSEMKSSRNAEDDERRLQVLEAKVAASSSGAASKEALEPLEGGKCKAGCEKAGEPSVISKLKEGTVIAMKTAHGLYLSAQPDGQLMADRGALEEWEKFTVVKLRGNTIALKSHFGKYVTAEPGKWVTNRGHVARWEMLEVADEDGGAKMSVKAHTGYWLSVNKAGRLEAKPHVKGFEKFLVEILGPLPKE
eukprot:TRINITY_DN5453_c0_g1_i1.p1 TRINITY_DN5453_c0_g1~~TRINITY_DN5453_c0_g1_i1.p1  ORF type:complete len:311 (-),score=72.41 TRINITY_DN5453_c0_g1_i1:616-1548(-)